MIRSFLTLLAALTLVMASLTAGANAMRMADGTDHAAGMQMPCVSTQLADGSMLPSCGGAGDLSCAFACAVIANPASPARLHGPISYGSAKFFVSHSVPPEGRGPDRAERPPRLAQL